MPLFSHLRRSVALFICPELEGTAPLVGAPMVTVDVEFQLERSGRWVRGRFINGELHWVPSKPTAADLEAIRAAFARANQTVPAAIAALLPLEDRQVADEETRPASQRHHDHAPSDGAARLRFRLPQSGQRGAW